MAISLPSLAKKEAQVTLFPQGLSVIIREIR